MYCKNCGREIDDKAYVCVHCGVLVGERQTAKPQSEGNALAIVGFVLSFLIPIAGLVCSILGYNKAKNEGLPYQKLAYAGIIISVIVLGFYVAASIFALIIYIFSLAIM